MPAFTKKLERLPAATQTFQQFGTVFSMYKQFYVHFVLHILCYNYSESGRSVGTFSCLI